MINTELTNFDYFKYQKFRNSLDDKGVGQILSELSEALDCTKMYKGVQIRKTIDPMYQEDIEKYIRIINTFEDYVEYNRYFDLLLWIHETNVEYEEFLAETVIPDEVVSRSTKPKKRQNKPKNIYIRHVSNDVFTGDTIYIYDNLYTGDSITSTNPNLLDELNTPKKKTKAKKDKYPLVLGKLIFKKR